MKRRDIFKYFTASGVGAVIGAAMSGGKASAPSPESLIARGRVASLEKSLSTTLANTRLKVGQVLDISEGEYSDGFAGSFVVTDRDLSALAAIDTKKGVVFQLPNGLYVLRRFWLSSDGVIASLNASWFGVKLDGSDVAENLQCADDVAEYLGGANIEFGRGVLGIGSKVSRSPVTNWIAHNGGKFSADERGTIIKPLYDGILIECDPGVTTYCRNAKTTGFHFVGNVGSYPNAVAIKDRLVRQRLYSDLTITGFYKGHERISCGENYHDRVFISGCKYNVDDVSLADSWHRDSHYGSGNVRVGGNNAITAGGAGVRSVGGNNLQYMQCRLQVQDDGFGGEFIGGSNLNFVNPVLDQNDKAGLLLEGCYDVDVLAPKSFDNGVPTAKSGSVIVRTKTETFSMSGSLLTINPNTNLKYGVIVKVVTSGTLPNGLAEAEEYYVDNLGGGSLNLYPTKDDLKNKTNVVTATDGGTGTHSVYAVSDKIRITGGSSADRNGGENQSYSVGFQKTGDSNLAKAYLGNVDIQQHDVTRVADQFSNEHLNREGLKANLINGVAGHETVDGNSPTKTYLRDPNHSVRKAPLIADVNFTISTTNISSGAEWYFRRADSAIGLFSWVVKYDGQTIATLSEPGESAKVVFDGSTFERVL